MNEAKAQCVNHHGTQSFCNQKACLQAAFKENENAGFDICFDIIIAVNLIKRCCKTPVFRHGECQDNTVPEQKWGSPGLF